MKYLKSNLLALLLISALIFASCEDSNDPVVPDVKDVNPPTNLMANAKDDSTIVIKFTPSISRDSSNFKDYVLYISPGTDKKVIDKSSNMITITGLNSGTIYTFEVAARNTKEKESAKASVSWATATRFNNIRLYETDSDFGSGLELFNSETQKPANYKIADSDKWDLALDTRNDSYDFGSPFLTSYDIPSPRRTLVYIPNDSWTGVNSLDDVFDTEVLNPNEEQLINFTTVTKGFVIAVKTEDNHFAKVFVKAVDGKILQGTANNRYIEVDISYQKTANIPYAKVKPVEENDNHPNSLNSNLKVSKTKKVFTE